MNVITRLNNGFVTVLWNLNFETLGQFLFGNSLRKSAKPKKYNPFTLHSRFCESLDDVLNECLTSFNIQSLSLQLQSDGRHFLLADAEDAQGSKGPTRKRLAANDPEEEDSVKSDNEDLIEELDDKIDSKRARMELEEYEDLDWKDEMVILQRRFMLTLNFGKLFTLLIWWRCVFYVVLNMYFYEVNKFGMQYVAMKETWNKE